MKKPIRSQRTADFCPGNTNQELRRRFVVGNLFNKNAIELVWTDLDRAVIGGAMPGAETLALLCPAAMRAAFFNQRRELGVLNLGAKGAVILDGNRFEMASRDALYVGMGTQKVGFESENPLEPAKFYLVSYPAHQSYPSRHAGFSEAEPVSLGSTRSANMRTIYKYIHPGGIKSCQLTMGFTHLKEGSVWNTMPPHVHDRRSEIYLYFDLAPDARVFHFMGLPDQLRHLTLANEEAVLSPAWSIHCGVGTGSYSFAWAMGGENQEFADMDSVSIDELC